MNSGHDFQIFFMNIPIVDIFFAAAAIAIPYQRHKRKFMPSFTRF